MWSDLFTGFDPAAFVYTTADRLQDLNSLIDANLGIHLEEATDINQRGQILALSYSGSVFHTYLLTPGNVSVPEQGSTIILFGSSVLGLVLMIRLVSLCKLVR